MSDSVTPWTTVLQASLSMEFARQECWSALPFPSPGDLPNSGIGPKFPSLQADSLPSETLGKPMGVGPKCAGNTSYCFWKKTDKRHTNNGKRAG